jgi:hypothetical protein
MGRFTTPMTADRQICCDLLQDYYRVAPPPLDLWVSQDPGDSTGFFRFGPDIVCFGNSSGGTSPDFQGSIALDASRGIKVTNSVAHLPVDFSSVIENLRKEHYVKYLPNGNRGITKHQFVRKAYYTIRGLLPVRIRRHFQKAYFKNWDKLPFPNWPVDFTADSLHQEFLKLAMRVQGLTKIPFIWFWPDGASACAVLTHDVETAAGRDFSSVLMDLDLKYGFRASFQVVPEKRYDVPLSYWNEIRSRGFEFNVHDFNHDGYLFHDKIEFARRAKLINHYAAKYGSRGFRAGAMYRNLDWFDAFEFSYDMSVPNVAHLEPQRGGCCTVMPYFVGKILEIPLTTSQDYSVFNILEDYSIGLWKKQISMILQRNGLMSFLSHPDYLIDAKPRQVYESLLAHLRKVCDSNNVWHALPGELDQWWRARSQMKLVPNNGGWQIVGPESRRAHVAYAILDGDRLVYAVNPASAALS